MTTDMIKKQLAELIDDRKSLMDNDPEHDEIYEKDIDALKAAIEIIGESNVKRDTTRLIDANALDIEITTLIEEFERRAPVWSPNDMLSSGRDAALKYGYKADGAEAVLNIVRRMPTVDAAPVKHEKWKLYAKTRDSNGYIINHFVCSSCNNMIPDVPEGLAPDIVSPYCAKCGAKMGGDEK